MAKLDRIAHKFQGTQVSSTSRARLARTSAPEFIASLSRRYNVPADFVRKCCPMVETIFDEFEGATRNQLLDAAESAVARHSQLVSSTQSALTELKTAVAEVTRRAERERELELGLQRLESACQTLEAVATAKPRVLN